MMYTYKWLNIYRSYVKVDTVKSLILDAPNPET